MDHILSICWMVDLNTNGMRRTHGYHIILAQKHGRQNTWNKGRVMLEEEARQH